MKVTVRFHCPGCRKPWEVSAANQGRKLRCTCGHKFVLPLPSEVSPPLALPVIPPVMTAAEFRAGVAEIVAAIGGLSMLVAGAGPRNVAPDLELLYQQENADLHTENQQLATRVAELEKARDDLSARTQRLENNARRTAEDFARMLKQLLPDIELLKDSVHFLFAEIEDCSAVLRVLYLLQSGNLNTLRIKAFKSAPGWLEIDKNISNGRTDDIRVYYRKKANAGPYQVLVSRKGLQDQDKERLWGVE